MTQENPQPPPQAPLPRPAAPGPGGDRPRYGGPRPGGPGGGDRPRYGGPRRPRRKVCSFCVDKVKRIDYKDVGRIRRYLSDRGKIDPRRKSGSCAKHQRMLTTALKRARLMALLPYTAEHVRAMMSPQARAMAGGPPPPKPERGPYRPAGAMPFRPAGAPQPGAPQPGAPQPGGFAQPGGPMPQQSAPPQAPAAQAAPPQPAPPPPSEGGTR